jgi:(4-(4-[2-(gamma-L-glutamylamino)ethyl]phenoxymethyl)furan-2-yl)methanamine synthase
MTVSNVSIKEQRPASTRDPWVGLDIGGANLKAAHTSGWSNSVSFAMWREWRTLAVSIAKLLEECPAFVGVAVTMTGELADCFATRAEGVANILEQITSILPAQMVRIYCVDGSWKSVSQSARDPWSVAASNWHGLARFAVRLVGTKSCLLIDTGSTTTDLIPIRDGQIQLEAKSDSQRLQAGALVYTGIERSNVAAILPQVTLFGVDCPVMNEKFATMRDVYLWLGEMQDEPDCCETADNKPATREAARYRLARIVGEDGSTLADSDIDQLAQQIARAQTQLVSKAFLKLTAVSTKKATTRSKKTAASNPSASMNAGHTFECVAISGHGDFLIEGALAACGWEGERVRLRDTLGHDLSRCAPAYAIAVLASEELSECPK